MKREEVMDFLNEDEQKLLEDYEYIERREQLHVGDYIRYLTKSNFKFNNWGILIGIEDYPVLRVLNNYNGKRIFYNIDLNKIYLFEKRVSRTRRDFYEDLLKKLDQMKTE